MSTEFLLTSLIVVLAPGTGVLYTLACGLSRGASGAIASAFGCTLGILPPMLAATIGLAALLHASAIAFQVVKFAGVAYLLYMAWGALKEKGVPSVEKKIDRRGWWAIVMKSFLMNILNPKLSIFFLAFLPQFVSPQVGEPMWQMLGLGGVFMAMTFVVFLGYGVAAAAVRQHVISRPRIMAWMRRTFAGAFVLLGSKLAFAER